MYAFLRFLVNIDECEPQPCLNDGVCTDGINEYTCACVPGYEGDNCQGENQLNSIKKEMFMLNFRFNTNEIPHVGYM